MGFTLISLSPLVAAVHEVTVTLGAPAQDVTVGAVSTAVGQVRSTLGSPAQDTTVGGVTTAVGQVRTTLGTPAQDTTVAGVTTAVGQVRTTLGTPAQDTTVAAVSTAVGALHSTGHTIASELAGTSLAGTGLAQDTTVAGVRTALGSPAQDTTVAAVTTAVGGLHSSGHTIASELAGTSLAGTGLAQDTTVAGVRTALGTPAQDTTVAAVSTAVGALHSTGHTIAGELAVTSLAGTGLAKDTTVAGVRTALGSPAQDTTVASVSTSVANLHAAGLTIAGEVAATGTPLITNSQLLSNITSTSLASGASVPLGPYAISQIGYEISLSLLANASSATGGPVSVTLAWYDSGTGIQVGKPRTWWLTGATSPLYQTYIGTGPTRGNQLKVIISNSDPTYSVSYQLVILQNSRIYANDDWEQLTWNNVPGWTLPFSDVGAGIIASAAPSINAATTISRLLPLYSGTVNVTGSTSSAGNDGWISILTIDPVVAPGASVIHLNTNSQGNINQQDIAMPRAQCYMYLWNNNAARQTITASIFAQEQQTS